MKKILLLFAAILVIVPLAAQGIAFDDLTFQQALNRAKAEDKLVFMDCYTTWCSPCKYLSEQVFTQIEVGDFFNKNFINLKMDMEKGEGRELLARFEIKAYPTLLLIRPDGTLQHRILGSMDARALITAVQEGMDEKSSFTFLEKEFDNGNRDPKLVGRYFAMLVKNKINDKAQQIANELYASIPPERLIGEEFWFLFSTPALNGWKSERCTFLIANKSQFDRTVGKSDVDAVLYEICTDLLRWIFWDSDKGFTLAYLPEFMTEVNAIEFEGRSKVNTEAEFAQALSVMDGPRMLHIYREKGKDISPLGGCMTMMALIASQKSQIDENKFPEVLELIHLIEQDRAETTKNQNFN